MVSLKPPLAPAHAAAAEPPVAAGIGNGVAGSVALVKLCPFAARAKTELIRRGGTWRPAAVASSFASTACPRSSASWWGRNPASLRVRGPSGKVRIHSVTAAVEAPYKAAKWIGRLPALSRCEASSGLQRSNTICSSSR
eukprot:scaffold279331_cov22-Tisochrysis_lutea.AAC.1